MSIPNLLDQQMLNQVGAPPPIQDAITPTALPSTPAPAMPMPAPSMPPTMGMDAMPTAPSKTSTFAQVLVKALPLLLAGIAQKRGGTVASGALLKGYTERLEQQRVLQQRQHEFDITQAASDEERQARVQEQQAARQARVGDFVRGIASDLAKFDDPAQYAAFIQVADDTAQKAFGTPKGFLSNQFAGTFDNTKAAVKAQKDAIAQLARLEAKYSPEQMDEMAANGTTVQDESGRARSVRELMATAGVSATGPDGKPLAGSPKVPENEAAYIARGVRAAQKLAGRPLNETETNAKVAELRQQYAQSGHVTDPETMRHNRAMEAKETAGSGPSKPIEVGSPDYKVAQDLAFGRMTASMFRTLVAYTRDVGRKTALYALAGEINPAFNQADFERGFAFVKNPQNARQLSSVDNALSGVPDLLRVSDEAQRSGATVINRFMNPIKVGIGSRTFTNLRAAQLAWADEVSGALGFGTASDMKLALGLDLTDANLSPENFRSAIQTVVVPFLERKRASMLNQASVYGSSDNNSSVRPVASHDAGTTKTMQQNGHTYEVTYDASGKVINSKAIK